MKTVIRSVDEVANLNQTEPAEKPEKTISLSFDRNSGSGATSSAFGLTKNLTSISL